MIINIIVYLLLLLGAFYYSSKIRVDVRRNYIIFCSLILVLKYSLRSVTVGVDTSHYSGYFYESMNYSWSHVFNLLFSETEIYDMEPGYKVIEKFFSSFIPDFNLFTFFAYSTLIFLPIGVLMYRETKTIRELLFGYVLLNALFSGLLLTNARQLYAISSCIWCTLLLMNKKYIPAILCIGIAYTIHHSALLFLLIYIVPFIPNRFVKYLMYIGLVSVPLVFLNVNRVIIFLAQTAGNEKYEGYGSEMMGGGFTYIILSVALCIFAAIALNKCQEPDEKKNIYYAFVAYTGLFAPLIFSNGTMIRITMYFQIYFIMLIPKLLEVNFNITNKKIVYAILLVALMTLSTITSSPYRFFWEENQDPYLNWS